MKNRGLLKLSLLLTSMMTMMAGAIVAPTLPSISKVFSEVENIALLSRLVITLPALFIAISAPIFGILTDRYGRKKLLLISLVLYALSGTSGAYLENIYVILIGRAVLGIAVGGVMTIATALIGDYFKGDERNGFAGLQGAFMGVGGMVFIALAGILADVSWHTPFYIYLFSIPVLILGLIYLYEPEITRVVRENKIKPESHNKKHALVIYLLAFTGIVFFYMVPVQIPFLIGGLDNVTNAQIGYAISLSTIPGSLAAMSYKYIKKVLTFRQIYQAALLMMGIGYLLISQSSGYTSIVMGLLVGGIGTGLLMPTGSLWIMSIAPDSIRGSLVGRLSMATFLGMFFSPIILQPLVNQYEVRGAFMAASICLFLITSALFFLRTNKN
ncbi:MFS transporter [Bacteroidota bacterium]